MYNLLHLPSLLLLCHALILSPVEFRSKKVDKVAGEVVNRVTDKKAGGMADNA